MIYIHNKNDIEYMKKACRLASTVLNYITPFVVKGITTEELDDACYQFIIDNEAKPATLGYKGYKHSSCISVNNIICHGIPNKYKLKDGDIVNIDVSVVLNGYYGDNSRMFCIGNVSDEAKNIVDVSYRAMMAGIAEALPNKRLGDVGAAIQDIAEQNGYSIVEEYAGHGIGKEFHMDPKVFHFGKRNMGKKLVPGMIFTIEPMINQGTKDTLELDDGWTVITKDGKLSSQWEHTILITENGNEILTL